jgi:indole-3-glycerol phosphate synthase
MTSSILAQIVQHKREEIAAARRHRPEGWLRERCRHRRPGRPFCGKLSQPGPDGVNIIAEVKRGSPSCGNLRPDLNPAAISRRYREGGAAAISVLTDRHHFWGGCEDLISARAASGLPVLRKDFLISAYQIYESASIGSDAVLLIVGILTFRQLKDYLDLCRELYLDVLVEIHSEEELAIATRAGAGLIGINNRNLRTFRTDIDTSVRLASLLDSGQVAVAESGIRSAADVTVLRQAGLFNFLIGESLVRSKDPQLLLRTLMTASSRTRHRQAAPGKTVP